MKTILFAIAMRGLDSKNKQMFEEKTVQALKLGSREFADLNYVFCDYKEGLRKTCDQIIPDYLVVNENLIGAGNIFEIITDIKSDYPDMIISVLLAKPRIAGDAVLANLATAGIYNWVVAPWTPEVVANSLIAPKKMKDVSAYIPTFTEGANGLVFETKVVEKIEDELNDLPDVLNDKINNVVSSSSSVKDIEETQDKQNVQYKRVIKTGFGFGKSFKPNINVQKIEPESKDTFSISPVEEVQDFEYPQEEKSGPSIDPVIAQTEPLSADILSTMMTNQTESEPAITEAVTEPQPNTVEKSAEEILPKRPLPPRVTMRNKLDDDPAKKELAEKVKRALSRLDEFEKENNPESVNIEEATKVEEQTEVKPTIVKPVTKEMPTTKTVKANSDFTLSKIKFTPKYKKILFVRAMPISSIIPVHIAKLMNASFVDFNKTSNNDGYMDILRTTIKEAKMPETDYIVGDVVAGNGVEKLIDKFDYVIAILPDDPFAIKQFVERYPNIYKAAVIDKCTTASITRKQLLTMIPNADYVDSIKVDNCNRDVVQSSIEHTFLMDNPDYAEGMRFFLKDLGDVVCKS